MHGAYDGRLPTPPDPVPLSARALVLDLGPVSRDNFDRAASELPSSSPTTTPSCCDRSERTRARWQRHRPRPHRRLGLLGNALAADRRRESDRVRVRDAIEESVRTQNLVHVRACANWTLVYASRTVRSRPSPPITSSASLAAWRFDTMCARVCRRYGPRRAPGQPG